MTMTATVAHGSSARPIGKRSILIVEDESDLADMLRFNLQREGYVCAVARSGDAALASVRQNPPDLVLLDRMLPGVSGDEVVTELKRRSDTRHVPVILLTAKAEESDQLVGFALGADDYVTKPFSVKVLLARIAVILNRSESGKSESEVLIAGPIRMIPSRHEVTVDSQPVSLTATEFRLLGNLMRADGRVVSRSRLLDAAVGENVAVTDRTIDVHITALRKKLGPASRWIQTVRGVGYTFRQP